MTSPERPYYTDEAVDAVLAAAHGEHDLADWIARVLCTAAAELGSSFALVAGRPGSWEADAVLQLVHGTAGPCDEYLAGHRR
jgi:aminoglycoside phosphotransferase (APT) family kinase protein